jgi:tRNA modification GTPase
MFVSDDTIVAIATPPGRGGIGVIRLSGTDATRIASELTGREEPFVPRHATLTCVRGAGAAIDHVVVTVFPAPHSYTGEDVVEIGAHGSPVLLRAIVEAATDRGARLAEPGEFTFRAYLHGRMDLVQAEAVRDLVNAVTPLQARAAFDQLEGTLTSRIREADAALFDVAVRLEASLDFPEEGYHFVEPGGAAGAIRAVAGRLGDLLRDVSRGRLVREGAQVAILGRPNSGKSSLFNRLAGAGRAIVTDVPGTTRDLVTEVVDVCGIPITLIDTAGLREAAADPIEAEGMARARAAHEVASATIVVLDRSRPLNDDDRTLLAHVARRPHVVVANKIDLSPAWSTPAEAAGAIDVSATRGDGIDALRRAIAAALGDGEPLRDVPAITNMRHAGLVRRAVAALERAAQVAERGIPEEFVLADVTEARQALEEITGTRTSEDVLGAIFTKFCIGK